MSEGGAGKTWLRVLSPVILIVLGAGMAALGLELGFRWMFFAGLIVAGCGLLWGAVWVFILGDVGF